MSGFKDEVPMPLAESRNGRAIPEFLIRNDDDDDSADDMFGVYSKTKKQQQPQNDYDNDDFFFGANLDFGDPSVSSYSDSANGNNNSSRSSTRLWIKPTAPALVPIPDPTWAIDTTHGTTHNKMITMTKTRAGRRRYG